MGLAHHRVSVAKCSNPKVWGSIPHGDSEFFLCTTLVTRRKTSFSIYLPSSKMTTSLILFTNMTLSTSTWLILALCKMSVIGTLYRPRSPSCLCGLVIEHRSAESEGLRFDSSWELRIFSLSHAGDKTKNIFLYFFTELKTYNLSYSIY